MPAIWTSKQPWVQRPSGVVTLNRGSVLARRISAGYYSLTGNGVQPVLGPPPVTWATDPRVTPYGIASKGKSGGGVNFGDVTAFDGATQLSVSMWVDYNRPGRKNRLFSKWEDAGSQQTFVIAQKDADNTKLLAAVQTGGVYNVVETMSSVSDGLRHIGVVWDATRSTTAPWSIYIDGVSAAVTYSASGSVSALPNTTAQLYLLTNDAGDYSTSALLDLWWFRGAWSAAEVWSLYSPRTRWVVYQPIVRRVVFDLAGGGGGSPQTLSGSAASATWTVPAGTWAQGSVALAGSAATATWTVPSGILTAGAVALSGAVATAAWTVPTGTLTAGTVALSGSAASAAWSVPSGALTTGSVALAGSAATASWTVPSGTWSAAAGPQTLAGDAATAAWAVPTGTLTGAATLAGSAASAAWTVPSGALTVTTALVGNPASATWALPAGALTAGAATLSGAVAIATWVVLGGTFTRAVDREAWVALFGEPGSSGPVTGRLGPDSGFVRPVSSRLS